MPNFHLSISKRKQRFTEKHPAGARLQLKVVLMLTCLKQSQYVCVDFDGTYFAIKVETKVNLRIVLSGGDSLHAMWWVLHCLPVCAF